MVAPGSPSNPELHGWKEIAAYLGKSVRAAQRWERDLGLPVHRVKTAAGQAIFARRHEIDAWRARQEIQPALEEPDSPAVSALRRLRWPHALAVIGLLGLAVAAFVVLQGAGSPAGRAGLTYRFEAGRFVAADAAGRSVWHHEFGRPLQLQRPLGIASLPHFPYERIHVVDVDGDGASEVLAAVSYENSATAQADELYCFDAADGTVRWVYRPDMELRFAAGRYEAPWLISAVMVVPGTPAAVYVSLVHHLWWPAAVVRLDARGAADLRLVHSGHIYTLRSWDVNGVPMIAAGGINNEQAAASLAVFRANGPPVRSPEGADSGYRCVDCPDALPDRYFLFDRTELNLATDSPYNRTVVLQVNNGALGVQVQEDPQTIGASAIYHLSPAFQVIDARPGDGYGVGHRRAAEAGRLDHPSGRCPSFHADVRTLDPGGTWRAVRVPFTGPLPGSAPEPR